MPRARGQGPTHRIEQAVEQIDGVTASHVVYDAHDQISEIHVISLPARQPKQVVRDIESLLCARFGIRLDYRKISVVRLPEKEANVADRLLFVAAASSESPGSVRVTLETDEGHYTGEAHIEPADSDKGAMAAAKATLNALKKALTPNVDLSIMSVQTVAAGEQPICLVILQAGDISGERPERLTGTCLIRGTLWDAVSRATLDALNRRLVYWTKEESLQAT